MSRGAELSFVNGARRDRQPQRTIGDDRAEVAARSEHPSARIEPATYRGQITGGGGERPRLHATRIGVAGW